jgi:large subunit ribosomal protein L25
MATNAELSASPRSTSGKGEARKLRASGRIPAVVYGHGEATRSVSVDAHELARTLTRVHWQNAVFQLNIEGETGEVRALMRDLQRHPHRDMILHIDFHQIHAGESVHVAVPLALRGTAPGVRAGGVLQHTINDIEIRCSGDQIPENIEVDISGLEVGESIHVRDLALPEGVEVLVDADLSVCSIVPPTVTRAADEPEEAEPAAAEAQPEVIRRGREDEE